MTTVGMWARRGKARAGTPTLLASDSDALVVIVETAPGLGCEGDRVRSDETAS